MAFIQEKQMFEPCGKDKYPIRIGIIEAGCQFCVPEKYQISINNELLSYGRLRQGEASTSIQYFLGQHCLLKRHNYRGRRSHD